MAFFKQSQIRTASNLEDFNIDLELNSFESVGYAFGRENFWGIDEEYHDVDFYIQLVDDTEEKEIKKLLNSCGQTAWLEYDSKMVKVD